MSVRRVNVEALLARLGMKATRRGPKLAARCPSHDDTDPSWTIVADPRSQRCGSHHCFACGYGGGPWELVATVRGISIEDAARWIRQEFGGERDAETRDVPRVRVSDRSDTRPEYRLPDGVRLPSVDGSEWFGPALEYLETKRRVPAWQRERWHMGYALWGRCAHRVVIPVHTAGHLVSYVARTLLKGEDVPRYDVARQTDPGARPDFALFGEPGFDAGGTVTIAEGVFSALALERAGAPNPCAILGVDNLGVEKLDILASFDTALVATDPDRAGDQAFDTLNAWLCRYVDVRRVTLTESPDDASEDELVAAIAAAQAHRAA